MIQFIESYKTLQGDNVLKVFLTPTNNFPLGNNYFYTDDNTYTSILLNNFTYRLSKSGKNEYVLMYKSGLDNDRYHSEYFKEKLGYYPDCIDHINGCGQDNRFINLNQVSDKQNRRNTLTRGYTLEKGKFRVRLVFDSKTYHIGTFNNELDAIVAMYKARLTYYSDYDYNFLLDRRGDKDILDLELTGKISAEEAIYKHVIRYAENNAWYYYRFGLEQYFKDNNISVPDFSINQDGFLVDSKTNQLLCPYSYN